MSNIIALIRTFLGVLLPAVINFIGQHMSGILICVGTIAVCVYLGVKAAIIVAIISLIIAVLCQKDTMETVRQYYHDACEKVERSRSKKDE